LNLQNIKESKARKIMKEKPSLISTVKGILLGSKKNKVAPEPDPSKESEISSASAEDQKQQKYQKEIEDIKKQGDSSVPDDKRLTIELMDYLLLKHYLENYPEMRKTLKAEEIKIGGTKDFVRVEYLNLQNKRQAIVTGKDLAKGLGINEKDIVPLKERLRFTAPLTEKRKELFKELVKAEKERLNALNKNLTRAGVEIEILSRKEKGLLPDLAVEAPKSRKATPHTHTKEATPLAKNKIAPEPEPSAHNEYEKYQQGILDIKKQSESSVPDQKRLTLELLDYLLLKHEILNHPEISKTACRIKVEEKAISGVKDFVRLAYFDPQGDERAIMIGKDLAKGFGINDKDLGRTIYLKGENGLIKKCIPVTMAKEFFESRKYADVLKNLENCAFKNGKDGSVILEIRDSDDFPIVRVNLTSKDQDNMKLEKKLVGQKRLNMELTGEGLKVKGGMASEKNEIKVDTANKPKRGR
jgi:hypothetical protein